MIQDVTDPGWYYLTNPEFMSMNDRPVNAPDTSGYFLEVCAYATSTSTNVQQRLIRNSYGTQMHWVRIVDRASTSRSSWYQIDVTRVDYA